MRSYPLAVATALEGGRFAVRHAVRFDLDTGSVGVWNDTFSLLLGGVTYAPLAGNMQVSEVRATSELDSDRVVVTVSGLDPSVASIISNEVWHQRPCTLFAVFLNDAGNAIHAEARFAGFLDTAPLIDGARQTSTLTLTIESNARELNRSNGRTRSDADQRRISATDGFFKHAANAASDSQIYWGRKGPQYPTKAARK